MMNSAMTTMQGGAMSTANSGGRGAMVHSAMQGGAPMMAAKFMMQTDAVLVTSGGQGGMVQTDAMLVNSGGWGGKMSSPMQGGGATMMMMGTGSSDLSSRSGVAGNMYPGFDSTSAASMSMMTNQAMMVNQAMMTNQAMMGFNATTTARVGGSAGYARKDVLKLWTRFEVCRSSAWLQAARTSYVRLTRIFVCPSPQRSTTRYSRLARSWAP